MTKKRKQPKTCPTCKRKVPTPSKRKGGVITRGEMEFRGLVTFLRKLGLGETPKLADNLGIRIDGKLATGDGLMDRTRELYYVTYKKLIGLPADIVINHDGEEYKLPHEVLRKIMEFEANAKYDEASHNRSLAAMKAKDKKDKEQEQEQERLLEDIDMTGI